MEAYLGIDVGTSSVKLTAINETGSVIATAEQRYDPLEPHPGWREIDPETWWEAVRAALIELSRTLSLDSVVGVGVTGQMHTVVLADHSGRAVCHAILWNDQRTLQDVPVLKRSLSEAGDEPNARLVATGVPAVNMFWTKRHDPNAFAAAETFLGVSDWIACRLGGRPGIDYCGASTSALYNNASLSWSKAALEVMGIPLDMLPAIDEADEIIGHVSSCAAAETGLPEGIPIVRGTGDNPASAIPTGCMGEGVPTISLGTTGVLMYAREGVLAPEFGKPVLFKAGGTLKTMVQLSVRACGGSMEWWTRRVLGRDSFDIEDPEVSKLAYDMRGLMFYPHLSGEKVLHGNPGARGAFLGLDLDTSADEMVRAVMEGISFALRELKEAVPGSDVWTQVRLVGGGSKNPLWRAMLASILSCTMVRLETSGAGQGAALLALAATGHPGAIQSLQDSIDIIDETYADGAASASYDSAFARYQKVYRCLAGVYGW